MKVTQHGAQLWQLTRLIAFNSYLVRHDSELIAIDTGLPGSGRGIVSAAAAIGLPVRTVALTHAHTDHAGSLDELHDLLGAVEFAFTQRTAHFLQGDLRLLPGEPQAKLKGGFVKRTTPPSRLLSPGERIGPLLVVAAPGHAPDQIAYFDERDRILLAGDAFQTAGGIAVAGIFRWLFPLTAMASWHLPTALQTAIELVRLKPSRLAVGHGKVLENPVPAIERAIRAAEVKLNG